MRVALLLMTVMLPAAAVAEVELEKTKESLFENVAAVLSDRFYDEAFRENELP